MKKLILICGLLASGFSFGADWGKIGESVGLSYYYDTSSVKKISNYKFEFWQKQVAKNEHKLIKTRVDCISGAYTAIDIYSYKDTPIST